MDPALVGTQNVLESIDRAGTVKTLVYTSTVLAVQTFDRPVEHVFTEADWNDWSTVDRGDPYGFAKTQAERLVMTHSAGKPYTVRVINPGVVLGPVFCKAHTKASTVLVRQLLYRNKMLNYYCTFVDVRDVAKAHAEALERPAAAGLRFILVGDAPCMCTTDLGAIAGKACPEFATEGLPKYPTWMFAAFSVLSFVPFVGSYVMSEFERRMARTPVAFSNARAKEVLGMSFRTLEETVRDSARSMVDGGYVKAELRAA